MPEAHRPLNKYLLNEFTFRSHIQELRITGGSDGKEPACHVGDPGSIPGSGRSPGEGNGNPLQYSWLERNALLDCIAFLAEVLENFPGGSDGKASVYNSGDLGSIPGSGRPSGEGNGNPLQDSCLDIPRDRGAGWATVHSVAKS